MVAKIAVSAATYRADRPYDYLVPDEFAEHLMPGMRVVVPFSRGNRRTEGIVLTLAEKSEFDKLKAVLSVLDDTPVLSRQQLSLALWMREQFFCTVYDAARAMLPAGLWYNFSEIYKIAKGVNRDTAYARAERSKSQEEVLEILYANGGRRSRRDLEKETTGAAKAIAALSDRGVIVTENEAKRRIGDKTINMVRLAVSTEEAAVFTAQKKPRARAQAKILEFLCAIGSASTAEIAYFTGSGMTSVKRLESEGIVSVEAEEVLRRPNYRRAAVAPMPTFNEAQEAAFDGILELTENDEAKAALLFGVTGSGKTTIYIRLIDEMLKRGRSSILLVPEIALTPQMMEVFSSHFGENIAILHSSLAIGERYDEWKRIKSGAAKVVIGTRSAIFAPVEDIGLIIIDEEQDASYKSENSPRYHVRDVAKYRCVNAKALLLLGSATPDVESRYNAEIGKYGLFRLENRYNLMDLPQVDIVDMKQELRDGNGGNISLKLRNEIEKNLERGEQSILFINRRGASNFIACGECGHIYECPRCSVSLTYHSAVDRLMCHYCGHSRRPDNVCPECGGALNHVGAGTQKIVEELEEKFPGVGVLRMDTDTVTPAGSHDVLLRRFQEKKIPIMVGTQMVAKGLNLNGVTLVGVISADQSLYVGDYRAGERTFALITQVVGRSGRGEKPGRAVIQTFTPSNQTILQAAKQDYESFYQSEIGLRKLQNSPPFVRLYTITASGPDEPSVIGCCGQIREMLLREVGDDAKVLGPAPLPVVRVRHRYRYRVTLACRGDRRIRRLISGILTYCADNKEFRGISVYADVDAN